jgi:hypothetical protein
VPLLLKRPVPDLAMPVEELLSFSELVAGFLGSARPNYR